jgi:NhaA family Na+:H+ antiporter
MTPHARRFLPSAFRRFLESETAGGIVLMASAALALVVANSPLLPAYRETLGAPLAGLTVAGWINDGLMAVFFLLVGLEIKREVLHGQLHSWTARALPGLGALGGMIVPALIFAFFNQGHPSLRGWAIPSATDIAFALGVIALLGKAVPTSLKVFLTALAVLDDLGAVLIIALFYTSDLSLPMLGAAAGILALLIVLNRLGVRHLAPYLLLGVVLWVFVLRSGIHATVAGVLLAATIPADGPEASPLHRLESALSGWVAFIILPIFGFANAGVPLAGSASTALAQPVTVGTALGLLLGKQCGVFLAVWLAVQLRLASRPARASWLHIYGVSVLCGIGFTMSLFIGLLAFARAAELQDDVKIGVLLGSLLSATAGALVLRFAPRFEASKPAT